MNPYEDPNYQIPEKVFRDPVHSYIHVQHQPIIDLIDTKEFQRLRRIKQLGTSSSTFHGAEHSRFSHSLGVYEITRRICDKFVRNYSKAEYGQDGWDDEERLVALTAALLHDVGHGPFSHTFEKIFQTDHEHMTQEIILSPDTEVNQVLSRISPSFPQKVASVIDHTYPNPQVVQMISSQIDADRMDYLQRDAYYTGVTYGEFDMSRILRVIRPYRDGIVFQIQGKHAVEDYIVSRYQMYMQVYFHRVTRGMEVTLDRLLHRANDLYHEGRLYLPFEFLKPFFENNYSLEDYLRLDDGVLTTYLQAWRESDDYILSDLSARFLDRRPLKSVIYNPETDEPVLKRMADLIEQAGYDTRYYVAKNSSFDQPYDFYRGDEKGKTSIRLIYKDGQLVELSEVSELVNSITGIMKGDHRFFVPREFLSKHPQKDVSLFEDLISEFKSLVNNGAVISPE